MIDPKNSFTMMQKAFYVEEAGKWSPDNRDPVVGSFDAHNNHADYYLLFDEIDTKDMIALDFGCGPGRNIVKFASQFHRIDGTDIAAKNLVNAGRWAEQNKVNPPILIYCNGVDLHDIPDESYDLVMSTICLQHIPVHEIRFNFFKEFFRVLKPGGWFTAQMGFGDTGGNDADYFENRYNAETTNGGCDVKVTNSMSLFVDLVNAGFRKPRATIRPPGPCDRHPQWIFFRAQK